MATVSGPYGMRPINLLGGQAYAGSTRMIAIASGYAVNIQTGDPVIILNTGATRGTLQRMNATTTATTVTNSGGADGWAGVFLGVSYTSSTFGFIQRSTWVASTVASDAVAYVCDDPDALFQIQADGAVPQTALGCNASIIQTVAGAATYVPSGLALQASSVANTATLPLRIVDFVNGPTSTVGDAYTDCIVRINTHFQRQTTGTSAS